MKLALRVGATSQRVFVFIQDATSSSGAGLTGLTNASGGLVCYRAREDDGTAAGTQLSLVSATRGTFTSGGFIEKDATNMPGVYELGLDNAGLASGSKYVVYMLKGATNMVPVLLEVELVAYDPFDTVRLGLTALPNVAAGAAGGLPTDTDSSGRIKSVQGNVTGSVNSVTTDVGITQAGADKVWGSATRTLTSYGTLTDDVADAVLDQTDGVETGVTPRMTLRLLAAAEGGKTSGMTAGAAGTVTIRDLGDTKDIIVATVDGVGNRLTVTRDLS